MPSLLHRRRGFAAAAVWVVAVFVGCGRAAAAGEVTPSELLAAIDARQERLVLDVRTPEEFANGHVPGTVNVPIAELPSRLGELAASRDQEVVVYCERGPRAIAATEILVSAGFAAVQHLKGHMSAWRAAGLPVE
jgi:rhodanese-related sulfurtransferase